MFELACAGGALATLPGCPILGCGNANPDPCICDRSPPSAPQCVAERTCSENGGSWDFSEPASTADAGSQIWGHCDGYPKDANSSPLDGEERD
ncbi:MAG TPA: hypothetical protein VLX92_30075 [Kofleriaceae bacterium]|nr:hypothetical protein [Kofleriaceae bacterium]